MSFQNMDRVGGDRALGELVHLELRREAGEQLLHLANLLAIAHLNNIDIRFKTGVTPRKRAMNLAPRNGGTPRRPLIAARHASL